MAACSAIRLCDSGTRISGHLEIIDFNGSQTIPAEISFMHR